MGADPTITRNLLQRRIFNNRTQAVPDADPTSSLSAIVGDEEVQREIERIRHGDTANDYVILSEVTKLLHVSTTVGARRAFRNNQVLSVRCAVDRVSLGVRKGAL